VKKLTANTREFYVMADDNKGVFMNKVITNEDIYNLLNAHGETLEKIEAQTTKTNGRVTKCEEEILNICTELNKVKKTSIVLWLKSYYRIVFWVVIFTAILSAYNSDLLSKIIEAVK
jgi:predicted DCC family thiol-disulfide oxidoreductase YuxK